MNENLNENLLVQEWASGLRLTTVPQAMDRLGLADDLHARWRISEKLYHLRQSILETPEKVQRVASAIGLNQSAEMESLSLRWLDQVASWGLASILLTDNEKLVARDIWGHNLQGQSLPRPAITASSLDIPIEDVHSSILMLTRLGFLATPGNSPQCNYSLTENAESFLRDWVSLSIL